MNSTQVAQIIKISMDNRPLGITAAIYLPRLLSDFVDAFAQENPDFDKKKFLIECGADPVLVEEKITA